VRKVGASLLPRAAQLCRSFLYGPGGSSRLLEINIGVRFEHSFYLNSVAASLGNLNIAASECRPFTPYLSTLSMKLPTAQTALMYHEESDPTAGDEKFTLDIYRMELLDLGEEPEDGRTYSCLAPGCRKAFRGPDVSQHHPCVPVRARTVRHKSKTSSYGHFLHLTARSSGCHSVGTVRPYNGACRR